ncbi:MAG: rhomboid family intramembrane serine protease [Deltaproteobacteria bacterium]|nr:rhomboid family intramembrane serine protease [Deltaproteobacteria bacterium]
MIRVRLNDEPIARLPVATLLGAFLAIVGQSLLSMRMIEGRVDDDSAVEQAEQFWAERPYLRAHPSCAGVVSPPRVAEAEVRLTPAEIELERKYLESLCEDVETRRERATLSTWGFLPEKGPRQLGLITSVFIHERVSHLLATLFFILLAGLLAESRLGFAAILALSVSSAAIVNATRAFVDGDPAPIVGASGAAAAMVGAALRIGPMRSLEASFGNRSVSFPTWVLGGIWVIATIFGLPTAGPTSSSTLFVHLFAIGLGAAFSDLVIRFGSRETTAPKRAREPIWVDPDAEERLRLARKAAAEGRLEIALQHYRQVLASDPAELEALHGVARVSLQKRDLATAKVAIEKLFAACAEGGRAELVPDLVRDLDSLMAGVRSGSSGELGVTSPTVIAMPTQVALKLAHQLERAAPELSLELFQSAARAGGLVATKAHVAAAELARDRGLADLARLHATAVLSGGGVPVELERRARAVLAALLTP